MPVKTKTKPTTKRSSAIKRDPTMKTVAGIIDPTKGSRSTQQTVSRIIDPTK
jgi:hypothetical protein